MKTLKYFLSLVLFVAAFMACTEDEFGSTEFVSTVVAPTNVIGLYNVTQDNTGLVTITPNSEGAVSYDIYFGDGTTNPVKVSQGNNTKHTYAEGSYEVKIIATGITGLKTEVTQPLVVSFKAPENVKEVIENDAAISKKVNVTVTGDYATMFEVYFGEEGNDEPVSANIGDMASYVYQEAGTYTIRIVVMSAAVETYEIVKEFEVTAILQPLVSAPEPIKREEADYISIYSDKYMNVEGSNYFPDWGQAGQGSSWAEFDLEGDKMLNYINLSYQGIDIGSAQDASAMEMLHIDIWTADEMSIDIYPLPDGVQPEDEKFVTKTLVANKWNSFDIPMSEFTDQGLPIDNLKQFKFVGAPWAEGTVFIDNLYFWREPSVTVVPLYYDDFDGNSNIDTWFGDACGMNNAFPNPFKEGINTSNTVLEYNDDGGQYANVRFDIAPDNFAVSETNIFSLKIYVPSSSITGSQPNQISLKLQDGTVGEPWAQQTEIIKPIVLDQWQTITFDFANDVTAGAADPLLRTDFNRVVLQVNSENNNDNVIAYIDDFNYGVDDSGTGTPPFDGGLVINGDFENGAAPWIIGVGSDPVPVVTEGGNTYYSVNVTAAGNPYDVNMSQKLEIIADATYTLTFDAWSDINRPIIAGIGLSADPWSNTVETVDITTTKQTFSLTLEATGFGAFDARVLFDLGAAVGMVNIDNVSLFLGDTGGGTPPPAAGDIMDFEPGSTVYEWTGFGASDFSSIPAAVIANPDVSGINTSVNVVEIQKLAGAQTWAGASTPLDGIIDFSTGTTIKVKVWSPRVGTPILFKTEDLTSPKDGNGNPTVFVEVIVNSTVANAWEELSFDLTTAPSFSTSISYGNVVLFPDFGSAGAGESFYFDDISVTVKDAGTTPPPSSGTQIDLPVTFEDSTVDYTLTDFGENASSLVADPTNASNTVAKVIKTAAAATWAGTTIGTDNGFATNIPITLTNSKMTVRVWSPDANTPIRLKIEDANDNTHTCETEVNTTVTAGWETIEFDFTNQAPGTELLSVGLSKGWVYNKASIFFNFGTDGATAGEKTYYFDDVLFVQ